MSQRVKHFVLRTRPYLVFPPAMAILLWIAGLGQNISWPHAAGLFAGGLFVWTFVEYVFHRGMHLPVKSDGLRRFQDTAHLRHHREPHDVEHSVINLSGSIPLALFFFGAAWLLFRDLPAVIVFHAGMLTGYLAYEFVHLATHANWRLPGVNALTRYHNRHHFDGWNRTYGVTSPLWDWVFGTLPGGRAQKSKSQELMRS